MVGAAVVAGAGAAFVAGMRSKSPLLQDPIRSLSKRYGNPRMLRSAGRPGVANGIVRHVGRVSGRTYATAVTPVPIADGFLVGLPYTSSVDWAQNVLAAGRATIVHDGEEHEVTDPRVVSPDQARPLLSRSHRAVQAVLDVQEYLRVTSAEE